MTTTSFLWHDYETFGRDPIRERPAQFAAIRTDAQLEEIEDPTMIYCRQSPDYLPDPESCLVHGVIPQTANSLGESEWTFADKINHMMSVPGTCSAGYNNIRFDDEFSRQLFFRNLLDPYAREWSNGNSRWDLIDIVRLTRALRPEGIEWPVDENGKPTNKLEKLTDANGISHANAHDALSDVYATIAMAKLIRKKQPRLYEWAFNRRKKMSALAELSLVSKPAVIHVSGMFSSEFAHTSIVMPVGTHPVNQNGILVYDLRHDPTDLIKCSREEIAERLFTKQSELPEHMTRIPVKTVHANRCPVIAPLSALTKENITSLHLNVNQALKYREMLLPSVDSVQEKLTWAFSAREYPPVEDPELTLYAGSFASAKDRAIMQKLHAQSHDGDQPVNADFDDDRLREIWFRARGRSHTSSLNATEKEQWYAFCRTRVNAGLDQFRNHEAFTNSLIKLRESHRDPHYIEIFDSLEQYGQQVVDYSASN